MAGSSSGESNYWPGFVDALTNVVIAMVFVIVVLAIALSFSAQMLARRMAEKVEALQRENVAMASRAASATTTAVAAELPSGAVEPDKRVTRQLASNLVRSIVIPVRGDEAASAAGGDLTPTGPSLVLDYETTALNLDSAAQQRLEAALKTVKERLAQMPVGTRVTLIGRGPELAYSDNQRAAFLRIMGVRNVLIDQDISSEIIATRIDTTTQVRRPSVSIVLEPGK